MPRKINHVLLKWLFSLAAMLLIFSLIRAAFHMFNADLFAKGGRTGGMAAVYFWGFRYDLAFLFIGSLPVLLLMFLEEAAAGSVVIKKAVRFLSVLYYGLITVISVADVPYFRFNGRRATREVFDVMKDSASAFPSFLIEYAGFVVFALILVYAIVRFLRRAPSGRAPLWLTLSGTAMLFLLAVNFGNPLTPKNASFYVDPAYAALATNTPMSLGYSILKGQSRLSGKHYFKDEDERRAFYDIHYRMAGDTVFTQKNVVIFILESFSREYFLKDHVNRAPAPFMDSLMKRSTVFTNAFANGTTSSYGLMSILGGIPPFMDEPYFSSIYGDNRLMGIGSLLSARGYTSHFFYGAEDDHYGFRKNMSLLGIDHYHSMEDFKDFAGPKNFRRYYDGNWGVYDGPFFQYAASELNRMGAPFFAAIFNISTHFPYMVPPELADSLAKGSLPSHQSIAYTDLSIRRFFESIRDFDWYGETVFVFIADHWAKMRDMQDKSAVGIYRIPFFIFDPSNPVGSEENAVAQQVDVVPTLLEILDYSGPWMSFGRPALSDTCYRFTFNEFSGIYRIIDSSFVLAYDGNREESFSLHNYREDGELARDLRNELPEKAEEMEKYLKAVIQAYHNQLISNDIYIEPACQ